MMLIMMVLICVMPSDDVCNVERCSVSSISSSCTSSSIDINSNSGDDHNSIFKNTNNIKTRDDARSHFLTKERKHSVNESCHFCCYGCCCCSEL